MNTKETMIKNLLVTILGNGSKNLNLKGTISFDLDVSFKEDCDGNVTVDVNRDYDSDVNSEEDVSPKHRTSNGSGWDSIEI